MHDIKHLVDLASGQLMWSHIPHDKMVVSAISDELLSRLFERFSNRSCVCDDLGAVLLKSWCSNLLELDSESTNLMVMGTALKHGENGKVDSIEQILLAVDDT